MKFEKDKRIPVRLKHPVESIAKDKHLPRRYERSVFGAIIAGFENPETYHVQFLKVMSRLWTITWGLVWLIRKILMRRSHNNFSIKTGPKHRNPISDYGFRVFLWSVGRLLKHGSILNTIFTHRRLTLFPSCGAGWPGRYQGILKKALLSH